jgi:uncharacterized membrane protein
MARQKPAEARAMWASRSIGVWLAIMVMSGPAFAAETTPDPALRYQVVDVAADDQLNVREGPGVDARVLGGLAPHADNLIITGAVTDVGGSDWWEIVFVEGYLSRGWVNGRFLEAMDLDWDARERDYPMQCSGTEPFWSLELEDGEASYSDPDGETLTMRASQWRKARGLFGTFAVQLEHQGEVGYASVWRERFYCSDGMSDIRYPFGTVLIRPDGEVFAGCCRRAQ